MHHALDLISITVMIVFAVNIHTGGGKVLLDELIEGRQFGPVSALFVDSRYDVSRAQELGIKTFPVYSNLKSRMNAELDLTKIAAQNPNEEILFFGNLPPKRRLANKSILYLQSCFLLSEISLPKDSLKLFLRIILERCWLQNFIKNINVIWVQTRWMTQLVSKDFPTVPVEKRPFLPELPKVFSTEKKYDFISVTSFLKHKNIKTLIKALEILDAETNKLLSVALVLDSSEIPVKLKEKRFKNIKLNIVNNLARQELAQLYSESKVSVVTSSLESFCLPLHESAFYKLKIIALDTPFARESGVVSAFYSKNSSEELARLMANTS